ncbi:hypothetical protein R6U77_00920 [Lysinibacillus louembei]|uniref:Uncharacterized protein n=1 Tax=Lysinibacillus louembei TaxID=1470088 RepID=A0ABZ0RYB4_9BACI|nr:hypothetical protein [Lysinibacillus louembei]WPK12281.1 hypothetical protein R6U77_00920 [Lysinibacillus louembei]
MKLWEIIEACAHGAYIAGDTFVNEMKQEIYFDGYHIKGMDKVDLNATWAFVEPKIA